MWLNTTFLFGFRYNIVLIRYLYGGTGKPKVHISPIDVIELPYACLRAQRRRAGRQSHHAEWLDKEIGRFAFVVAILISRGGRRSAT